MDFTDLGVLQSGLWRYWSLALHAQYGWVCKFVDKPISTMLNQWHMKKICWWTMEDSGVFRSSSIQILQKLKEKSCQKASVRGMSSYEKAGKWDLTLLLFDDLKETDDGDEVSTTSGPFPGESCTTNLGWLKHVETLEIMGCLPPFSTADSDFVTIKLSRKWWWLRPVRSF